MTPQQIVGLAARLFSIWLVLIAVQMLSIGQFFGRTPELPASAALGAFFAACVLLIVAILLWLFPMFIGHKLVPKTHYDNKMHLPAKSAALVGCVILGLWAIINQIPNLVGLGILAISTDSAAASGIFFGLAQKYELIGRLACAIFGAFLVFKPWAIADVIFPEKSEIKEGDELDKL
ncbi:hypothetical protein [Chitiniphilus shinanonensis]|uniref:hypothetical protein n=1 Tax=Chitiniphilus shinanonensis TaxID=553088 RepID=UPI003041AB1F